MRGGLSLVEPLWEAVEPPMADSPPCRTHVRTGDAGTTANEATCSMRKDDGKGTVPLRFFVGHTEAFEEIYAEAARSLGGC